MRIKRLFVFSLALSGIIFLSACVPENSPSPTEDPSSPRPNPYPYPAPEDDFVRPTNSTEPYPEPEPPAIIDPYPGVDDSDQITDPNKVIIENNFSPISADKNFNRGPAFVDSSEIVLKESFPVQVDLILIGSLPTPCHQLRVIAAKPNADGQVEIEVYSVSDPEKMCIQVLEPFEALIPLGDYTEGSYTFLINGEPVGEIKLP